LIIRTTLWYLGAFFLITGACHGLVVEVNWLTYVAAAGFVIVYLGGLCLMACDAIRGIRRYRDLSAQEMRDPGPI
jgi:hypothetical protein